MKESKAHSSCAKRVFASQEGKMDEKINIAQKQLEMEGNVSKDIVSFLESKHEMLQEEIQGWINKYDQDMDEKEKELETLKTNKANNLIRFAPLPLSPPFSPSFFLFLPLSPSLSHSRLLSPSPSSTLSSSFSVSFLCLFCH